MSTVVIGAADDAHWRVRQRADKIAGQHGVVSATSTPQRTSTVLDDTA
ncbi:hypothetical protein G3I13_00630 [Streptomyces sp. SID6673]|nr:hypothetical protein [Streptomyces sp. SID11726]NEB22832.1 hypothetical protein [Streptomyces sp. SID6673]